MSTRICFRVRETVLFYAALADETRLRLLSLMREREICVCYLQQVLKTNQPKISRHLAYLKKAGLVVGRRDGKWTHYRLTKLDNEREKILLQTLASLGHEKQITEDARQLRNVAC